MQQHNYNLELTEEIRKNFLFGLKIKSPVIHEKEVPAQNKCYMASLQ